jgi:hypothetical protein
MEASPKARIDGKCLECKRRLPLLAKAVGDPFCSARCCAKYHQVQHMGSVHGVQVAVGG